MVRLLDEMSRLWSEAPRLAERERRAVRLRLRRGCPARTRSTRERAGRIASAPGRRSAGRTARRAWPDLAAGPLTSSARRLLRDPDQDDLRLGEREPRLGGCRRCRRWPPRPCVRRPAASRARRSDDVPRAITTPATTKGTRRLAGRLARAVCGSTDHADARGGRRARASPPVRAGWTAASSDRGYGRLRRTATPPVRGPDPVRRKRYGQAACAESGSTMQAGFVDRLERRGGDRLQLVEQGVRPALVAGSLEVPVGAVVGEDQPVVLHGLRIDLRVRG